jgi:phosphoribosylglycinamide formyltransferase-1
MKATPSVTVLISGQGSNLEALHEKARGYRIAAVVSNKTDARGLEWAEDHNLRTFTVRRDRFADIQEFKAALLKAVKQTKPDLVALAGFMVVLPPEFVDAFAGRLVNLHPSLLPKFPGLDTFRRVIEARETEHGSTIHYVDRGVDTGPIIAQVPVPIHEDDTIETLSERTRRAEHRLYPWVVRHIAEGSIALTNRAVVYSDEVRREASALGYRLNRRRV